MALEMPQLVGLNGPFIDNHLHVLIYKAAINLLPPYLREGIHIKSVGTYSLSAVNSVPRVHCELGKRSFQVQGCCCLEDVSGKVVSW